MSQNDRKRLSRREALGMFGIAGAAMTAAACGDAPTSPTSITTTSAATTTATPPTTTTPTPTPTPTTACVVSPSETIGPYPSLQDFVRSDIRENKQGLPLTLTITVVNTNAACAP